MRTRVRIVRIWFDVVFACLAGMVSVLTLVKRDWIETVFGVDPDHHSGSLEWMVVVGCVLIALTFSLLAMRERRAMRPALG